MLVEKKDNSIFSFIFVKKNFKKKTREIICDENSY